MTDPQHGDLYEVTYEDGTAEMVRGWNIRMVADSSSDPHHKPVKIERLSPQPPASGQAQWVKVEFYAQLPDGQVITDINRDEVGANLLRTFGFQRIDAITAAIVEPQPGG